MLSECVLLLNAISVLKGAIHHHFSSTGLGPKTDGSYKTCLLWLEYTEAWLICRPLNCFQGFSLAALMSCKNFCVFPPQACNEELC